MKLANRYRLAALRDAAQLVCSYCGERAFPDDKQTHVPVGPNEAGNYVHEHAPVVPGGRPRPVLCTATSIWALVRFEYGREAVTVRPTARKPPAKGGRKK